MRNRKRLFGILFAAAILFTGFSGAMELRAEAEQVQEQAGKQLDVMFFHDMHSHLNSFETIRDGQKMELGGLSRIKTLIDVQKEENPDTLILDGGDFSMGTLVQTIFETDAAEIRMLGQLDVDVTTLGNHEFDYRSQGLANMLNTAASSGDSLPALAVCNVDWGSMEAAGLNEGQKQIKDAFDNYGVQEYVVLEKGDVDVAVIGVFGIDALECSPTCELIFKDPVEAVKETVAEIKSNEDVDMIVCVSHSGTWEDPEESEDEILAKSVPELDLIVSAHTHTELSEPIVHGDTYIVSAGEYGKNLGSFTMEQKADGRWNLTAYTLTLITTEIPVEAETQQKIDTFIAAIDTGYLVDFGYTREQVLAQNDVVFSEQDAMSAQHTEQNLGNIMSDAYIYAVNNASDFNGDPVDVAVVPSGTVRDTYAVGDITVESVYNSFSLGIGADGVPGYPLISVYLTGEELKMAAEIDASISDLMTTARLYMSGLHFTYNPNRMILNRVTDAYLVDGDGNRVELEKDKLYRVVADLYSGQMLASVNDMSAGLLSLVPKFADGMPIENFEDAIITIEGRELKAWDAIARYMQSFPDTDGDGIANVPASYSKLQGRKVVDDSRSLGSLLKNPNKYAVMIVTVVLILILLVVLLLVLVVKLMKCIRRKVKK